METLRSGQVSALVDPRNGGRLVSLCLAGTEIIGAAPAGEGLPASWFQGCFPMAPYAGRLRHGRFEFEGEGYAVPLNAGEDSAHGLVDDVPWSVVSRSGSALVLSVKLGARWPFGGRVDQAFHLTKSGLTVTLTASNETRPMPAALGFHPWFRRDANTGGLASYSVRPRLRFAPDENGSPRVPTPDLGVRPWDDVFTGLEEPPTIRWPNGPTLRIRSSSDIWIVYERLPEAFCIEPITAPPDSLGTDRAAIVRPGEPLVLKMGLSWDLPGSRPEPLDTAKSVSND